MNKGKLDYIDRLRRMSGKAFAEAKTTPEYKEVVQDKDPTVKEAYKKMFSGRISDSRKREKILELMYTSPDMLFECIRNIQEYRRAKNKHKLKMVAFQEMEKDRYVIQEMQEFDQARRDAHNNALASFCRVVVATSPNSYESNPDVKGSYLYTAGFDPGSDLYTDELRNPLANGASELPSLIRSSMTDGMIKGFLGFLEKTYGSDWEISRAKVLERLQALGKITEKDRETIENRGKGIKIDAIALEEEEDFVAPMGDAKGLHAHEMVKMFHRVWHGYR